MENETVEKLAKLKIDIYKYSLIISFLTYLIKLYNYRHLSLLYFSSFLYNIASPYDKKEYVIKLLRLFFSRWRIEKYFKATKQEYFILF